MTNNIHKVKIINSPRHSNLEIAGDLVLKLDVPYSSESVKIKVNPNIIAYQDDKDGNVRQLMKSKDTDETQTLTFDFQDNNVHTIKCRDKDYKIKLDNIGTTNEEGQDFKTFEFSVEEVN